MIYWPIKEHFLQGGGKTGLQRQTQDCFLICNAKQQEHPGFVWGVFPTSAIFSSLSFYLGASAKFI